MEKLKVKIEIDSRNVKEATNFIERLSKLLSDYTLVKCRIAIRGDLRIPFIEPTIESEFSEDGWDIEHRTL